MGGDVKGDNAVKKKKKAQWGTADAEIKVPPVEISQLSKLLSLKSSVGQIIAMHAPPSARNYRSRPLITQSFQSVFL